MQLLSAVQLTQGTLQFRGGCHFRLFIQYLHWVYGKANNDLKIRDIQWLSGTYYIVTQGVTAFLYKLYQYIVLLEEMKILTILKKHHSLYT